MQDINSPPLSLSLKTPHGAVGCSCTGKLIWVSVRMCDGALKTEPLTRPQALRLAQALIEMAIYEEQM